MNRKNIERNISRKINKWVKTISDTDLQDEINKNIVITRGCIVSLLTDDEINDYDVYFNNKETTLKVAKYYVNEWKKKHKNEDIMIFSCIEDYEALIQSKMYDYEGDNIEEYRKAVVNEVGKYYDDRINIYIPSNGVATEIDYKDLDNFEQLKSKSFDNRNIQREEGKKNKENYIPVFISSNAITLSDGIQIICRFYGEPDEIHKYFDFVHCTNYFYNNKLVTNTLALESIFAKELFYVGSKYPLCSLIRIRKFVNRGWYINAGQILKICLNLQDFDLNDVDTLKDQLMGVDSLYFSWLINAIHQDLNNKEIKEDEINSHYIIELIDKIF